MRLFRSNNANNAERYNRMPFTRAVMAVVVTLQGGKACHKIHIQFCSYNYSIAFIIL